MIGSGRLVVAVTSLGVAGCLLSIDETLITGGGGAGQGGGASGGEGGGPSGAGGAGGGGGAEPEGSSRILYTDLVSGPKDGGQDGGGAFVTVFGRGFGAAQGDSFVTVGGGVASRVVEWTDRLVSFQLGPESESGDIVVHVEGDGRSNGAPFTVRTGKIFFVDELGDDTDDGTFEAPFETLTRCVEQLAAGGICYARDGVVQELDQDAGLILAPSDQEDFPKAIVSYPGETARIESAADRGVVVCEDAAGCGDDGRWVLSRLRIEAPAHAIEALEVKGLRVVGASIACSSTTVDDDCVELDDGATELAFLGNTVTIAAAAPAGLPAALRVGMGARDVDIGWSSFGGASAARGIFLYGVSSFTVHDNVVEGVLHRGIDLVASEPEPEVMELYNNVVFSVEGTDDTSACVALVTSGATAIGVRHNTLYDCASPDGSCIDASASVADVNNNILVQLDASRFVRFGGIASGVTGNKNLFVGGGAPPNNWMGNVQGPPSFAAPESGDFHIDGRSAAADEGRDENVLLDHDGVVRSQPPDLGAYEATD